jgi:hypothetical protein
MAATVTARSTAPARRAPARRHAPVRKAPRRHTPVGGFVPVAVGRTAGAVGGIADAGLFVWLTRGRLWIGLLGALLVGIVGLNVMALSFSSSSSNAAGQADELKRLNSGLRAQIATTLSTEQVQGTATQLGLLVPEPGSIRYVSPSPDDAARAAHRLRDGDFAVAPYVPPVATVATDPAATEAPLTDTAETDPAVTTDAATTDTGVTTDPAATETPLATDPATAGTEAIPTATSAGAVGAP